MTQEEIQKLRGFCDEFAGFRGLEEDGNGNSLHDIKNTFDYVKRTIDEYNLTGTAFGSNLSSKAAEASSVLSQLWLCLDNLEKSVTAFCDEQERNNGQEN